jgi:predicted metal-dependent enzyme (double-stranded beta helix superfamily)
MLQRLIDDLRRRAPLERTTAEMAALLTAGYTNWSPGRALIARPGSYTRTLAYGDENFEVVLLNWSAGVPSAIHDHGDQHCWMLVIDGTLLIEDFARLDAGDVAGYARVEARGSSLLEPGGLDLRAGRFSLHRVAATPAAPVISLHVYSGRLHEYLAYDDAGLRCKPVVSEYDDII